MSSKLKPYINIGPGQIIKREMRALNWSQEDLSEIIGMSAKSVSLILNNKQSITVETARLLANAFDSTPEFWLNLEQNYRLRLNEEGQKEKETASKAKIRKYMPILEMKKRGWIECDKTTKSQIDAYCSFWNINTPDFSLYKNIPLNYCARQTKSDEQFTNYYTWTWRHKAGIEAKKIKSYDYYKDGLIQLTKKLPEYTMKTNGVALFINDLNKSGVKTFVLSHLSKTYLDGASFFDGNNPVAVYTARYNRLDNFWWTITHEIAHIIRHLKNDDDCFLDNLDIKPLNNEKEREADDLAGEMLHLKKLLASTEAYKNYMSEQRLEDISKSCGLHPSVALGILQHNGIIDYRTLNRYKRTVLDLIPEKYKKG